MPKVARAACRARGVSTRGSEGMCCVATTTRLVGRRAGVAHETSPCALDQKLLARTDEKVRSLEGGVVAAALT